jgi:hypothetical protein
LRRGLRWEVQAKVSAGAGETAEYDDTAIRFLEALWGEGNICAWEAMQKVLDSGEHRPTHLRGWKPDKR